jgi:hypothetical protein
MPKSKSSKSRKTVTSTAGAKPARGGRSVHAQDLETPDLLPLDNDTLSKDNVTRQGGGVDARTDGTNGADDARVEDRNVIDDMRSLTATV